ncbi:hypothetical protein ACWF82_33205 [Nocardia sp. NPDC055053]
MSRVTTMPLSVSEPLVDQFSDWLRTNGAWLRAGALNRADIPAILAKAAEFAWREPDTVQM